MHTICLDRDGVINDDTDLYYVLQPDQLKLLPGAAQAIAALNQAQIKVVVITNQRCVGRGLLTEPLLQQIHQRLEQRLAQQGAHIDAIFYCPHDKQENCTCRKPKPGMLLQAQAQFGFDPAQTWMVGDSVTDMQAAEAAGQPCALVGTGHGQASQQQRPDLPAYADLAAFVDAYLHRRPSRPIG
ncbi:D-alpha,beta-D-heptose 1,7-bisphosphate phosphatase [Magnetococcus marinus MC-1]|uniref:D,D-heptose 1,7-bisphosphate phosphatase n=1 Tax=Magnetococcus marinus (strain ATCC BAA-1437 / JCM 17883 / MC-1) TaxID=156889 RepID=A0L7X1_MAGMM|nr:D-glycero-beta-D-manno-heptose 1,7-bisphosphate 7-phosphatase [Magnetococcus marinus]ABK44064.1 D-alpha,beta-D-heptose 1,7-bisphosphate phosphatase [Magnetococcus marinus MC-1]